MPAAASVLRVTGRIVSTTLMAASVLFLCALGVGPRTGRYQTLTVLTGSMSPGIPAGSIVFVAPEPARALRVGQVITYQIPVEDHRVVTHRVFKIIRGGDRPVFVTKGDANNAPDAWTAQAGGPVMWRERLSVPHVGYAIWALRSHVVHRALVLGAPVLFVLFALASIWRPARAELTPA